MQCTVYVTLVGNAVRRKFDLAVGTRISCTDVTFILLEIITFIKRQALI
jgi:hypothetical protein